MLGYVTLPHYNLFFAGKKNQSVVLLMQFSSGPIRTEFITDD